MPRNPSLNSPSNSTILECFWKGSFYIQQLVVSVYTWGAIWVALLYLSFIPEIVTCLRGFYHHNFQTLAFYDPSSMLSDDYIQATGLHLAC